MTRPLIVAALLLTTAFPVVTFAKDAIPVKTEAKGSLAGQLHAMEEEWARIKYQVPTQDGKLAAIAELEKQAAAVSAANAGSADAKIWEAIILATDANITKSLSGLPKVEKAKNLLEQSLKIDSQAMAGAAHMTLGSLYYQVPGWPISYGDDDLAEQHLKAALEINPNGMDTNYWYGMFLLDNHKDSDAAVYLQKAVDAPDRGDRKVADEGRRKEAQTALSQAVSGEKQKARGNE